MKAGSPRSTHCSTPAWHVMFLALLPTIVKTARSAFRFADPEAREEAVQEVVANALVAFVRLLNSGKADLAYATVLARYGIAHVRAGRRIGAKLNAHDVSSPYAQRKKGFRLGQLATFNSKTRCWEELLVEDRRATPADTAAIRLDFAAWLTRLPRRLRRIALVLGNGETTSAAARRFRLSAARISQIRQQLHDSWDQFQCDHRIAPAAAAT